jgi:hypothetical protein
MLCRKIGPGFHPDTPLEDYVRPGGEPSYDEGTARRLQSVLDYCLDTFGDEIYDIAMSWYDGKFEALEPELRNVISHLHAMCWYNGNFEKLERELQAMTSHLHAMYWYHGNFEKLGRELPDMTNRLRAALQR